MFGTTQEVSIEPLKARLMLLVLNASLAMEGLLQQSLMTGDILQESLWCGNLWGQTVSCQD